MIKVRFAPSPTGNLHIGSARTALFNYLFAKHHKGKFVVRIEDTDKDRSAKEYEKDILDGLNWLGMQSDEKLIYQSQRGEIYQKYIDQLLATDLAYKDKDTPAIYFKIPREGETVIKDLVKGDIFFQNKDFKDQVILKSDGTVTYNFAVVIDDALMEITHIIRGEDHISNTPKQIFFYQALGFTIPEFAHIPMILGPDKTKLSKRHGATSINEYRNQGYLPEAINNYLALLGWTPVDGQELMTTAELIKKFDLDRVGKSNSIFDIQKLQWLNGQKIRALKFEELIEKLNDNMPEEFKKLINTNKEKAREMLGSVRDNLTLTTDFEKSIAVYFNQNMDFFEKKPEDRKVIELFIKKLNQIDFNNYANGYKTVEETLETIIAETGYKKGQVLKPIRLAISGQHSGPNLKYLVILLGKETTLRRLKQCV